MRTHFVQGALLVGVILGTGWLVDPPPVARAQSGAQESGAGDSEPAIDRSSLRRTQGARETSGATSGRRGSGNANAGAGGSSAGSEASAGDGAGDAGEDGATREKTGEGGLFASVRGFVKAYAGWILAALGAALAATLTWIFIAGRRRRGAANEFLEPLDDELGPEEGAEERTPGGRRYSSTRIRARDVANRMGSSYEGSEVETDREYALVVEEDALRTPSPGEVDEKTGKEYARDGEIRESVRQDDWEAAFRSWRSIVEADGETEFHTDVERALADHFLRQRDHEKAAAVYEHHVATHARDDIDPEVYLNLGYIHALGRTYPKSRRFLRLYLESGPEPQWARRAQGILEKLESGT